MVNKKREKQLKKWVSDTFLSSTFELLPIIGDASLRRYFRLLINNEQYIVMDAPPETEPCQPFVDIAKTFNKHYVNAPKVHYQDQRQGFLILTDFGDTTYLKHIDSHNADLLYKSAIDTLIKIQTIKNIKNHKVADFNRKHIQTELNLFNYWVLEKLNNINLTPQIVSTLDDVAHILIDNATLQPQVLIHRDYHSRNLMYTQTNFPAVLDFQDAMFGPLSYDLVSLLRDCYINCPEKQVDDLIKYYLLKLNENTITPQNIDYHDFKTWFDLMGVQRHLKAIGIFARLHLKYKKPNYLKDIPRTLKYIINICKQYEQLNPLLSLINNYDLENFNLKLKE